MCNRNRTVDVMRLVFSIIIVLLHATQRFLSEFKIFTIGSLGVDFFFIVSGFLMAQSALKYSGRNIGKETRIFITKKVCSILPEMITAWLIAFVVTEWCREYVNIGLLAKDFLMGIWDFTFLQMSGLAGNISINGVTWYLSAMILAMLLLFPLLIKDREIFLKILAPVIAVFILGYLCKVYKRVVSPTEWLGFCYKGFLRAAAELALGCVCWDMCQFIGKVEFTKFGKYCLTGLEAGCYLFSIFWMWGHSGSKMDFIIVLMLAVAVTISFSGKSCTYVWFSSKRYAFCAKLSFYVYLGHHCWAKNITAIFPLKTDAELLIRYIILIIITVSVIHVCSTWLRWVVKNKKEEILKWFIKVSGGGVYALPDALDVLIHTSKLQLRRIA